MANKKIQEESWYQEIAAELRGYKKYKARIDILESRMIKQTGPNNKVLAQYGGITDGNGSVEDTDEIELEFLKSKVNSIDLALGALTETERRIIELKFFERHKNVMIYDMALPMAPNTFYKEFDSAMRIIYGILK